MKKIIFWKNRKKKGAVYGTHTQDNPGYRDQDYTQSGYEQNKPTDSSYQHNEQTYQGPTGNKIRENG